MTATIRETRSDLSEATPPEASEASPSGEHGPGRFWALPAAGLLAGTPLVVYSFHYAATHQTTQVQFDLFWLGILAFALPAGYRALCARTTPTRRWTLVALVGAWDFLPKFLRDPGSPLFSDELAHYRQAVVVAGSHKLYPDNPLIPIIRVFPGQQALTAALHDVTGLSIWTVAESTLLLFHVATVVGIMALAARLTGSYRAAAISALFFATTANFMFFDSEYSYESIGLPLAVWALVAAVNATGRGERPAKRWTWVGAGSLIGLACAVTHHLSSYVLAGLLLIVAASHTVAHRRGSGPSTSRAARQAAWTLALVLVAACGFWLIPAHQVFSYYSPYLTSGFSEVTHLLGHKSGARTLFKATTTPLYEQVFAFAGPPILLALAVVAYRSHRRRLYALGPSYVALVLAGVLGYFASLPFILTSFGSEGAHRSWTFSYIGVALLAGPVLDHYLSRGHDPVTPTAGRSRRRRLWPVITAAVLVVLLIGNTASSVDVEYRFPGPYVYGSDTRSLTDELLYLTQWFQQTQPANPNIITDRYTGLPLGGFDGANLAAASKGFPFWEMYFDPAGPPAGLLVAIGYSNYDYLIVDSRMAKDVPLLGVYFSYAEPQALTRTKPVPVAALDRYHLQPWAIEVFASSHYSVYRLDSSLLQQLEASQ